VLLVAEQALAEVAERAGEQPGSLDPGDAEPPTDSRRRHCWRMNARSGSPFDIFTRLTWHEAMPRREMVQEWQYIR
jgi:hypothetical protein